MATAFVKQLGTNQSKSAGTSLVISPSSKTVALGNTIFVGFAADDVGSAFSINDNLGNTYSQVKEQINTGNSKAQLWKAPVTSAGSITSITISWTTNITAKAAVAAEFSDVGTLRLTDGQNNTADTIFGIPSQTENNGELWLSVVAWECDVTDSLSAEGSAGTPTSAGKQGTTGGGAASNITALLSYSLPSTTTAARSLGSFNATSSSRDGAGAGAIYNAPITGTTFTQTLNETLTITDSLVRQAGKVFLETLTTTDTLKRDTSAIKSETLTITDTLLKQTAKPLTETLTLSDVLATARIYLKELLETLTISDTISKLVGWVRSETFTLTDTVNKANNKLLATETLTVTDTITKQAQKPLTETYTVSDVLTKQTGKPLPDTLVVTDTITKTISSIKSESITVSDTLNKQTSKPLIETITLSDVLATIRTFLKELTETIVLSDTVTKVTSKVLIETLTLTDTILKGVYKVLTETLGLEDTLLAEKTSQAQAAIRRMLMRVGI